MMKRNSALSAGADSWQLFSIILVVAALGLNAEEGAEKENPEAHFLHNVRQLTFVGAKNGEAYFSPDGSQIVFQGVREPDNPFYQIYRMDLSTGKTVRVSSGIGKTTCAYFHPKKPRLIFASTHLDPQSVEKQKAEIEKQKSGPAKRYAWDFDPAMDIFETDLDGGNPVRLTNSDGYDAEGSYSPDGNQIVFCSMRDGDAEIYVMDSDGKNAKRLTNEKGYDGGPFFSPDGKQIVWRHFSDEAQKTAEVWVMNADGSNKRQITKQNAVSWAPYFTPSMQWIVFAGNHEDPSFEIYAIRPDGSDLTRITHTQGFDGLPVISPDGRRIMWTSNRAGNRSQIFIADLELPSKDAAQTAPPTPVSAQNPNGIDTNEWWRNQQAITSGGAPELEHGLAKMFHKAGVLPPGAGAPEEDTSYILGPAVAGWLPSGKDGKAIAAAAMLKSDDVSSGSLATLLSGIAAVRSVDKAESAIAGLAVVAGNEDEMSRLISTTNFVLKERSAADKKLELGAFVSFAGLGGYRSRELIIRGVGSSPGWREMAERLAARHPEVSISVEDDPAGAPELAQYVEKQVPSVAFGRVTEQVALELDAEQTRMRINDTGVIIATAVDCIRLLARGEVKLPFTEYNAAAAHAAEAASQRPYLGTIPEYKSEGIKGVKLSGVRDGSPAQKTGLKSGDVVVELAGVALTDVNDYLKALESLKPGAETDIKILRDGQTLSLKITPATR